MSKKDWFILAGAVLLIVHMVIIAEDVQAIVDDPRMDNKPTEILKLAVDLSRYWPK